MHENSILLFRNHAVPFFVDGMRILEIGPDNFPSSYRREVAARNLEWDTLDIYDSPSLTFPKSDPYEFAIPDNRYDLVLSGNVIEHVPRIWKWMTEVKRVTKPGGLVVTINPVSWPYHEAPIDCWRIFPEGMKALCEDTGLVPESWYWGSLEGPTARRYIPGRSFGHHPRLRQIAFNVLRRFGGRVEKAFDNIMVARKPFVSTPASAFEKAGWTDGKRDS